MSYSFGSYEDYWDRGPWVPHITARKVFGTCPVSMVELEQQAGAYPDPPMPDLSVQIVTRGVFGAQIDMGMGKRAGRFGPGSMVVAPPNTATDYVLDGPHTLLVTAIPFAEVRSILESAAPNHNGDFGLLHDRPFYDPLIVHLCNRLWLEAGADNPHGRLFVEGAVLTLVAAILQRSGHRRQERSVPGAASRRIRIAIEYLMDHLAEDVSLSDLAAVTGLSAVHFARAFKRAVGVTPHRYLLQQRVERAKSLLGTTNLPIAEVGLECGFCHQAHLTTAFRRLTGVTPNAFREARRG